MLAAVAAFRPVLLYDLQVVLLPLVKLSVVKCAPSKSEWLSTSEWLRRETLLSKILATQPMRDPSISIALGLAAMVKQTRTAVKQQREPRATKSQRSAGGAPVPATAYTSADLVARAQSLLDAFDLDAARRFAERALEVDDACVEAVELLGVCALELGDVEGAKEVCVVSVSVSVYPCPA